MLNDRTCTLCGHRELDRLETQEENVETIGCPVCGGPFKRHPQCPVNVEMNAARAIDVFDRERAKCALGHGNTSLRF